MHAYSCRMVRSATGCNVDMRIGIHSVSFWDINTNTLFKVTKVSTYQKCREMCCAGCWVSENGIFLVIYDLDDLN